MFDPNIWNVDSAHIEQVKNVIDENESEQVYQERLNRNVKNRGQILTRDEYWQKLVGCVITTRLRSGPGTNVHELLNQDEFPLRLDNWPDQNRTAFAQNSLADNGIPGRQKGEYIAQNYNWFRAGGGDFLMHLGKDLQDTKSDDWTKQIYRETGAALAMKPYFKAIGPKQSRNYWQWLGLSQYEIPLDSRILNWIETLPDTPEPIEFEQAEFSSERNYRLLMSWIQAVCKEADVLPTLLDAAVFSSQQD